MNGHCPRPLKNEGFWEVPITETKGIKKDIKKLSFLIPYIYAIFIDNKKIAIYKAIFFATILLGYLFG